MHAVVSLVHPAFAAAAEQAAAHTTHEGVLAAGDDATRCYSETAGDVQLSVQLTCSGRDWLVAAARHEGGTELVLRGVMDVFCQVIEGLPLQEAADHGAIRALERIADERGSKAVDGILTPRSAGTAFTCCETLIRNILARHRRETGDDDTRNFWNPPLSAEWRRQTDVQRVEVLEQALATFRSAGGLTRDDLWITQIDKARRVIVGFGDRIGYDQKPRMLMRLEVELRRMTGNRLELFMEEKKDTNQIRRLGPSEENP